MEWGRSIFIIVVFLGLSFYTATTVGVKNIKENWPEYRCNPLYMPFASTLAPVPTTASKNFSFCMNDFMLAAAPALMQPLSYVQSMTLALSSSMQESTEKTMSTSSGMSFSIGNLFSKLFSVFSGIVVQFRIMLSKLVGAQAKMMATITTLMYIVTATQYAFVSMWNGIPGALIKFLADRSWR